MTLNHCAAHRYAYGNNPLIVQASRTGIFADTVASSGWETRRCMNPAWCGGTWVVQQDPAYADLWRVARHLNDSVVIVEAIEPVCPRCRSSLATMLELPNRSDTDDRLALKLSRSNQ